MNPTVLLGGLAGGPPTNRLTFPAATRRSTVNVGLVAALAAALLYGCYLAGYKQFFGDYPAMAYLSVVYAAAAGWYLPVTVPHFTKLASLALGSLGALLGIAALTGVAIAALFEAIRWGDVSYVAPLNKLVPLFVLPLEFWFFEAGLSALQVGGVVLATAGVYAANYESGNLLDPFRRALSYRPAQLALVSAALFGVADTGKRLLLQDLALPAPLVVWTTLVAVTVVVAPLGVRQRRRLPRRVLPFLLGVGAFIAFGNHLIAISFAELHASVASAIINAQAVVAVLLGGAVLNEGAFGQRLGAGVLTVCGVAFVALG
nr:EamA family transporter [Halomarina salina]